MSDRKTQRRSMAGAEGKSTRAGPVPTLRTVRKSLLEKAPSGLDQESLEVHWISEYLCASRNQLEELLSAIVRPSEARAVLGWDEKEFGERLLRSSVRTRKQNLESAREALDKLTNCAKSDIFFHIRMGEDGDLRLHSEVTRALETIHHYLSDYERRLGSFELEGNFGSNRSREILKIWPVLEEVGFSWRSGARILSRAFQESGLGSADITKLEQSIYQAIRNAFGKK